MGSSTISLGLGLGGGKSATSSGTSGGGGGFQNEFSLSFDGTDDFMSVASDSSLDTTGDCSASFWVYLNSTSGYRATVCKRDAGTHNWQCGITGAKISLALTGAGITLNGPTTITTGAWHHIAFSVDIGVTNGAILYLNGSVEITGTASSFNNNSAGFRIGDNTRTRWFDGEIDEVAWFHTALDATDISTLRGGASVGTLGVPADISSLDPVAWWRMGDGGTWDGTNWSIPDASENSNTGTTSNMVEASRVTDVPS